MSSAAAIRDQLDALRPRRSTASPAFFERLLTAQRPERIAVLRKLYYGNALRVTPGIDRSLFPGHAAAD